uniref:Putative ovule protein n=1 Tax=Solanum chacoense TaxID=4108 RepID=A0A0V0GPX7_SOLCH
MLKCLCKKCDVCQRSKADLAASPGLLQPLPIPEVVWSQININFIDGLPKSYGYKVILVVVDRLSKYGHFIPLKHPIQLSL